MRHEIRARPDVSSARCSNPGESVRKGWDEGHDMAVVPLPAGFGQRARSAVQRTHTLLNRAGHTYIFWYEQFNHVETLSRLFRRLA
jgi:hypothetical protein